MKHRGQYLGCGWRRRTLLRGTEPGLPGLALTLASLQSAISELEAPAWSCPAEPSLWPDIKRERVSFCGRVVPCDGASVPPGQRQLSKTFHTHRGSTALFNQAMLDQNAMIRRHCERRPMGPQSGLVLFSVFHLHYADTFSQSGHFFDAVPKLLEQSRIAQG